MGKVLGIVYRTIATCLIHKAGLQLKNGSTGAVTADPADSITLSNMPSDHYLGAI